MQIKWKQQEGFLCENTFVIEFQEWVTIVITVQMDGREKRNFNEITNLCLLINL